MPSPRSAKLNAENEHGTSSRSKSPSHTASKSNDFKNDDVYSKDGQSKSKSKSTSTSHTARPPSPMVNKASFTPLNSPKTPRKNKSALFGSPTLGGAYTWMPPK